MNRRFRFSIPWLAACLVFAGPAAGQTPDEHAAHHPAPGGQAAAPQAGMPMPPAGAPAAVASPPGANVPAAPPGGAMAAMGAMMAGMGAMMTPPPAPATPIYPSLMTMPPLTPASRAAIDALASQQMYEGLTELASGSEWLEHATQAGDHAAMQQSVGFMREGLGKLDAGIAARRVLSEGKAPRNLALDWFKREMSLASPVVRRAGPGTGEGLTSFHLVTMVLLIAFAFTMLALYFFKMRRAAALFGRIEPDKGSPPPGSPPPPGGSPGPSGQPGGRAPPAGGTPTATPGPGSASPPEAGVPKPPEAAEPPRPTAAPPPPPDASSPPAPAPSPAPPLTAKWRGHLRVASIVSETPVVKTYRLGSPDAGALPFTFTPGQFLNVAFGIGGARMNRSYSFSSSPNERDYVELSVKREERGAVSRHLHDLLKVGDEVEGSGPVGTFTFSGTEADSIVLIAAGVGITPLMSITRYLSERSWPGDIFLIYGCRTPADFIFEKAIAALERRNPKLHVVVTMSNPGPDWKGPRGRVTKELLTQSVPNLASRRVHLCGPPAMMDAIKALLTEIGVAPERLKTEAFGAVKPPLGVPGTTATPTAPATGPLVTFSKNNKSAKVGIDQTGEQAALQTGPGQTILELSEQLAIGIENSCRIGTCGVCKVKMTQGAVDMAVQDALDDDDKTSGIILACQAKPKTDVTVDA